MEETFEKYSAPLCRLGTKVLLQALSLRPASEETLARSGMRSKQQVLCWAWIAIYRNLTALSVATKKNKQGETKYLSQVVFYALHRSSKVQKFMLSVMYSD